MRNYFSKRTSGAPLHTLSKLYEVLFGFAPPLSFEAVCCNICGRRKVAVDRYRMICRNIETLTLKVDLLLKNFNIGYNVNTIRGRAFIFHMCIPNDKTFHMIP